MLVRLERHAKAFVVAGAVLAGIGVLFVFTVTSDCGDAGEVVNSGVCGGRGFQLFVLVGALPGALLAGIGGLLTRRLIDREIRERESDPETEPTP